MGRPGRPRRYPYPKGLDILRVMAKTSIEIDEGKLKAAGAVLGTRTKRATVDEALDEVIARDRRERLASRLEAQDGTDLADPDVIREAWR